MNRKGKKTTVFLCILAALLLIVFGAEPVHASAEKTENGALVSAENKTQVLVTGYKSSAYPVSEGKQFTLTLTLKNYSKDFSAENVVVTLKNPAGVSLQYGQVSAVRVGSIKANGTTEVAFKLTSERNISVSNLNFTVEVVSDTSAFSTQISLPVAETPEVCVVGYEITKTPIVPGDEFTLTLEVKNFSEKVTAKNVVVALSNPSGVIPKIGTVNVARVESIAPNTVAKVDFSFTATPDLTANELYFTATIAGEVVSSSTQLSIPVRKMANLYVAGYEVTNETVIPGNDFALMVQIKNQSQDVTVKNVMVTITNPTGVIPEYGKVGTAVIESLAPGATEEVCFRYSSESGIKTSDLNFGVGVFYDNLSTSAQIRIPVGKITDFGIEKVSMPEKLMIGKAGYASAVIENLEEKGVSNVIMVARCNGKEIASANIGTLSAKTRKTQSVSLEFKEAGQYAVDLVLTYTNGEGEHKEFMISSSIVQVVSEEDFIGDETETPVSTDIPQAGSERGAKQKISNIVLLSISGVLLIGLCCVILILLYRRKK